MAVVTEPSEQIFQPAPGVALQRSLLPYALGRAERKDAAEDADTNGSEDRGCFVFKKNPEVLCGDDANSGGAY